MEKNRIKGLQLKKLPKKPKANASIEAKERFLKRADEIKKENAEIRSKIKKSEELSKKISQLRNYM